MSAPIEFLPTPEECNELFVKACEDQQNGLLDSAKRGYLQLLDYFSGAPLLHYNLGLVYYEENDFQKSCTSFERAAALDPDDMDVLFNLGLTQKKSGDLKGAVATYLHIVSVEPESVDSLYNLAGCYKDSRQYSESIETYRKVLQVAPTHLSALGNLAYVYHLEGDSKRAIHHYQKVLDINPGHQSASHMLAALTGSDSTDSPESYVREVFDNYSDHYEQSLVDDLEYCVPATIRDILDRGGLEGEKGWKKSFKHGLDLGCGTGLGAQAFKDIVAMLDGVDLSEKMIALAEAKNIYRNLHAENITHFLQSSEDCYDFYLAADVFAYLGDLEETFSLLQNRARRDVLFCFSTETATINKNTTNFSEDHGYRLQSTGRFAYQPDYVRLVAQLTGWEVVQQQSSSLRKEKGVWVQGELWFLRLAAS